MVTKEAYRDAMARLGAAVNVITTVGPDGRRGFTASAVCSVTDSPPTLLVCCNRAHDSHATLLASRVLCVNTLAADQSDVSDIFAGAYGHEGETRFASGTWHSLETGSPVLAGAAASFDCRVVQVTTVGTHDVFFAEVLAVAQGPAPNGLVYVRRAYHPLPA